MRNLLVIAILAMTSNLGWAGDTANDVKCSGCINTGDIAPGAVKSGRIAEGGVTATQIRDGSITMDKLADEVKDALSSGSGSTSGSFVGFSSTIVGGANGGLKAFSEACIDTYGAGSRIATTAEIARSITFPDAVTNRAWVLPIDSEVLGSTSFCGVDGVSEGASIRTTNYEFEVSDCVDTLVVACAL